MGHYNQNRHGGGRKSGGFGGNRFGKGRDRGGSGMHQAVCSDCGKNCEVPFKPSGDKPVLCSDCFGGGKGRDFGGGGGRDRGRGRGRDFEEKRMHQAVCADCGNKCEVPFKPSGDKPVLCSDCFGGGKGRDFGPSKTDLLEEKFEELNKKLDKILRVLDIIHPKKVHVVSKEEAANAESAEDEKPAEEKMKKTAKKKSSTKKTATKKAAAKKTAKKKPAAKKKTTKKKA